MTVRQLLKMIGPLNDSVEILRMIDISMEAMLERQQHLGYFQNPGDVCATFYIIYSKTLELNSTISFLDIIRRHLFFVFHVFDNETLISIMFLGFYGDISDIDLLVEFRSSINKTDIRTRQVYILMVNEAIHHIRRRYADENGKFHYPE